MCNYSSISRCIRFVLLLFGSGVVVVAVSVVVVIHDGLCKSVSAAELQPILNTLCVPDLRYHYWELNACFALLFHR